MATQPRSALVLVIPEAEPLVAPWRTRLDPAAELGVPAHITLLYPFATPDDVTDDDLRQVAAVADSTPEFDLLLDAVHWFGDETIWLSPSPADPIIDLIRRLQDAFPDFPRYGGSHDDPIVPHLTVGDRAPRHELERAAEALAQHLPIVARATRITFLTGSGRPGSWRTLRVFPFRG